MVRTLVTQLVDVLMTMPAMSSVMTAMSTVIIVVAVVVTPVVLLRVVAIAILRTHGLRAERHRTKQQGTSY